MGLKKNMKSNYFGLTNIPLFQHSMGIAQIPRLFQIGRRNSTKHTLQKGGGKYVKEDFDR
jgi:hypothetical protein